MHSLGIVNGFWLFPWQSGGFFRRPIITTGFPLSSTLIQPGIRVDPIGYVVVQVGLPRLRLISVRPALFCVFPRISRPPRIEVCTNRLTLHQTCTFTSFAQSCWIIYTSNMAVRPSASGQGVPTDMDTTAILFRICTFIPSASYSLRFTTLLLVRVLLN